jgi:hypothetical protein
MQDSSHNSVTSAQDILDWQFHLGLWHNGQNRIVLYPGSCRHLICLDKERAKIGLIKNCKQHQDPTRALVILLLENGECIASPSHLEGKYILNPGQKPK